MEPIIDVANLTKRFGGLTAIDDISFQVAKGEIVGFLGPNGAGKTTTMRILSGFLAATGGTVKIAGHDVFSDSLEVRRRIGYLPEMVPLYVEMRVVEYLNYRGRLKGLGGKRLRSRLEEVVTACGLEDVRWQVIGKLSKGFRQRVGLADSLIHEPEVLILDEPTIGLDPNQIRQIRALIQSLARKHTVLLSSHILPEVEMICQRVLIINKGRIVAADRTSNLLGLLKGNPRVVIEIQGDQTQIEDALRTTAGVIRVAAESAGEWLRVTCECEAGDDPCPALYRTVSSHGWVLRELRAERKNLEDVFVEVTTDDATEAGAGLP